VEAALADRSNDGALRRRRGGPGDSCTNTGNRSLRHERGDTEDLRVRTRRRDRQRSRRRGGAGARWGNVSNPRGGFNDQAFLASLAARDVADIVYLDRQKIASYAAKGAFLPITNCIGREKINMKQYRVAAVKEVTYKGKVYAIPEFTNARTIIANDKVAAAAGVNVRAFSTTNWAALRATNRKVLQRDGNRVTRIGFDPKIPEFFPMWAKANGVDLLSKDGLKANLNHPKAIEALTFAYSLIQDHGGWGPFKSFRDTWDFFGKGNQVAQNQVGAWPMESFYYAVMARESPQVNITALPFTNRKGGAITWITGNGWAIPKGSKNPGLACKWMKAVTSVEAWTKAAKTRFDAQKRLNRPFTGTFTANKLADTKIFEDIYQKLGRQDFDNAVALLVGIDRYAFTIPASPAGAEFNTAMQDAINRVLAGQQSPRAALNQAQREAQAAINRAAK
jgi:multiple sugar transport system substrate-binding protein